MKKSWALDRGSWGRDEESMMMAMEVVDEKKGDVYGTFVGCFWHVYGTFMVHV